MALLQGQPASHSHYKCWQTDVSYTHLGSDSTTDSFTFIVTDPANNAAAIETFDITITPVNDLPVLDLNGGGSGSGFTATFTEDGGAVAIVDTDLSVTDSDNTNLASATITIANIANGADEVLAATTGATSISAAYANGVLELTGTDTTANYQQVLRTITYNNTSQAPDTTTRDIQFTVNDGSDDSTVVSSDVSINDINDDPVLDLDADDSGGVGSGGFTTAFTEDGGTVTIVDSDLSLTDDNTTLQSATVTLTNRPDGTAEVLAATVGATGIAASYQSGTGILTLTGPASVAEFDQVLSTITYNNTSESPDTANRVVTFVVSDGSASSTSVSSTITVTAQNDAPLLDNSSALTFTSIVSNTAAPTGDMVSTILASAGGDPVTDADDSAVEGIAVIDDCVENPCSGTWEYSINSGVTWIAFPGGVSSNNAVLLAADDYIRFVPDTDFTGTHSIEFRAWDQTTGTNGDTGVSTTTNGSTTAFSTAIETAVITVTMN